MASYLDMTGLTKYNTKIQAQMDGKVDKVVGKGLSTEDYTSEEKAKLAGLENYVLPAATETALGGVMLKTTTDPVPAKTALKSDASGKAFVDWTEAPEATTTVKGLIKLGAGFKVNAETGATEIDTDTLPGANVSWDDIADKPELVTKADVTNVYTYKGSVASYDALPTSNNKAGDVWNTEDTDMNYAWTGTAWDPLGSTFSVTPITEEEINALFA